MWGAKPLPKMGAWRPKDPRSLADLSLCLDKVRKVMLAVGGCGGKAPHLKGAEKGVGAKPPPQKWGLHPPSLEIPNSVTGRYVFY